MLAGFCLVLVLACCVDVFSFGDEPKWRPPPRTRRPPPRPSVPCYCVGYQYCVDGVIDTSGAGQLDVRFNRGQNTSTSSTTPISMSSLQPRYHASDCTDVGEVCCYLYSTPSPIITRPPPTEAPWANSCGWRNYNGLDVRANQLIGKEDAKSGEFPWQVAILRKDKKVTGNLVFKCGGSLIEQRFILTAAHCVFDLNAEDLVVRLGITNIKDTNAKYPFLDREVRQIVVDDYFDRPSLRNDIALLFLRDPVNYRANYNPVCLPTIDQVDSFVGQTCVATGWGKNSFKNGQFQTTLQSVELPIVDRFGCQSELRQTKLGKFFLLDKSFLCAGGQAGFDTCTGDGGGPLVCDRGDGRYVQIGIISWGVECGLTVPGVYVDVASFADWITDNINSVLNN